MATNIFEIAPYISDTKECIQYLRGRNLLLQDYYCCRQITTKVMDVTISDQQRFQCNICKKRTTIRKNSFFEKSKLPLTVLLCVIYFFSNGSTVNDVVKYLNKKISKVSIIQWFNYLRDVMTTHLENNPVVFHNGTVHVDETFIGGKRKYNRGRIPEVKPRYLFGITDKKRIFLEFVEKRDFIHIIPLITRHVRPGVTINTDGTMVYKSLDSMNYIHKYCIHKESFVNPIDGTNSNWIENVWGNLKIKLKSLRGSQKAMLDSHIDEYIYRYNRKQEGDIFDLLLTDISFMYRV